MQCGERGEVFGGGGGGRYGLLMGGTGLWEGVDERGVGNGTDACMHVCIRCIELRWNCAFDLDQIDG